MLRCRVGRRFLNQPACHGARSSGSCQASRERAPRQARARMARSRCPHLRRRADIAWLKDDSVTDHADLPELEEIAAEIVAQLQTALEEMQGLQSELGVNVS
jgi:hypothetical protein